MDGIIGTFIRRNQTPGFHVRWTYHCIGNLFLAVFLTYYTKIIIRFRKRVKAQYWWLLQGSIKVNALSFSRSSLELVHLHFKGCEDSDESAEITWRKEGWGVSWFCLLIYRIINSGSMYLHFTRSAETDTKDTDYEEVDPRKVKKANRFIQHKSSKGRVIKIYWHFKRRLVSNRKNIISLSSNHL